MINSKKIVVSYQSPLRTEEEMEISLRIANEFGYANDVKVLFNRYGEPPGTEKECYLSYDESKSNTDYSTFTGKVVFHTPGYRTFYIKLKLNGIVKKIKYDFESGDAIICEGDNNYAFWSFFVFYSYFETPNWVKGGIMYQIFVDTFCCMNPTDDVKSKIVDWKKEPKWMPDSDGIYRNDQFYGGNLRGIISKLDYIKSLNVTVIYLTPIFKSPSSNRYDIEDYEEIDEMIGSWDDLKELRDKAHELGISIVIDVVLNHSSNQNSLIKDDPELFDWIQKFTVPKCWWGYETLVEFNQYNERYYYYLTRWLNKYSEYADGIRLDVADNLITNTLRNIRKIFPKYLLGEVWKNAVIGDFREFLYGDELDGVMNYQYGNAIHRFVRWGNYKYSKQIIEEIYRLYPHEALAVSPIFLSSHDTPRIPNILVGDYMKESPEFENIWDMEKDRDWFDGLIFNTFRFRKWEFEHEEIPKDKRFLANKLHKIAVFMQYTLPGLPSIFAGDEVGVIGFKDPFNRKSFPWDNINKETYEFYCMMGKFRIENREYFSDNDNFSIDFIDEEKLIYKRGELVFIVNRTANEIEVKEYDFGKKIFALDYSDKPVVPAYSAIVIKCN